MLLAPDSKPVDSSEIIPDVWLGELKLSDVSEKDSSGALKSDDGALKSSEGLLKSSDGLLKSSDGLLKSPEESLNDESCAQATVKNKNEANINMTIFLI